MSKSKSDNEKRSFVLYYDYREHLELLTDEELGQVFMALFNYAEKGVEPDLKGAARMAFSFIRAQLDRDAAKYKKTVEKRREAGQKGGRPSKESESNENQEKAKKANGFSEKQSEAKKADNDNVNVNVTDNVNVNDTDNDIYIPPKGGESTAAAADPVPYAAIVELYHTISKSYPKLRTISDNRKKAIAARYREHKQDLEVFRELFTRAEASPFLKGKNKRNWRADFNWLMSSENMAKVLEGNYDNERQEGEQTNGAHNGHTERQETDEGPARETTLSGFRMAGE